MYPCNLLYRGILSRLHFRLKCSLLLRLSLLQEFPQRVLFDRARGSLRQAELALPCLAFRRFNLGLCHQTRVSSPASLSFPFVFRAPSRLRISSVNSEYSSAPREFGA